MKKFNLEEYLKHPTQKVVTGDGRNVRIVCTDVKDDDYPILVLVEQPEDSDHEDVYSYTKEGHYYTTDILCSENNLFFAPEKHEGWMNIYKHNDGHYEGDGNIYNTEEECKANQVSCYRYQYLTTIKIEWEEQL